MNYHLTLISIFWHCAGKIRHNQGPLNEEENTLSVSEHQWEDFMQCMAIIRVLFCLADQRI